MPSTKGYLDFVLEQLSGLEEVAARGMMGEYILYYRGWIAGGIYDDRLLVKPVAAARALLPEAPEEENVAVEEETPAEESDETVSEEIPPEPYVSPIDFESLQAMNPDIYAWIEIPGTDISPFSAGPGRRLPGR